MHLKLRNPFVNKFLLLVCVSLVIPALFSSGAISNKKNGAGLDFKQIYTQATLGLYNILSLDSLGLSKEAFNEAITGYLNLQKRRTIQHPGILSIVDFSLPSFKKRLFVLDIENGKIL